MTWTDRIALALVLACAWSGAAMAGSDGAKGPAYEYILWDGHRFAASAEQHERDIRYFKDLGFTHSLLTCPSQAARAEKHADRVAPLLKLFEKYDMTAGLRFVWDFRQLETPWEQMVAKGMTLRAKPKGDQADYNPVHPEIVRYCADSLVKAVDIYRKRDPHGRIGLFLLGSEKTWSLPKRTALPPAAAEVILEAARADGVLAPGEDDWAKLGLWWSGAHGKGRDYRIRKAFEEAVRSRIPDADFMIDPIWAVKIVHGFGGTWSYIGKHPLGMADAVVRIKAMCWPAPAAHSVQLIRGANHDNLLEGNLLSVCMGVDKPYHWGINTFEPGRPWTYRYKGPKTPEAQAKLTEQVLGKRRQKEPALRSTGRLIRERGELLANWRPMAPRVAVLGGVYGQTDLYLSLIVGHVPFEVMRNPRHRAQRLAKAKYAWVVRTAEDETDYGYLRQVDQAGGTVFVPVGFTPPAGAPPLTHVVEWDPEKIGTSLRTNKGISFKGGGPDELRTYLHERARYVRTLCRKAGLLPYFDSENFDVVLQPYLYKGHPMLFVVNDRRQPFDKGVANDVEILVRDRTDGLKVIDIDTGKAMTLTRSGEGWTFRDTVGPAWYKIYAVVKGGQTYAGPPPLKPGPAVLDLKAGRQAGGVTLSWRLPFDDWVGCDVARYRIYRAEGGGEAKLLADVEGRIVAGAGGVVTRYVDAAAEAGKSYVYRLRTLTPLRTEGPLSGPAKVGG